jgi:hypothetical protein
VYEGDKEYLFRVEGIAPSVAYLLETSPEGRARRMDPGILQEEGVEMKSLLFNIYVFLVIILCIISITSRASLIDNLQNSALILLAGYIAVKGILQ